jgi:hypothetical protein
VTCTVCVNLLVIGNVRIPGLFSYRRDDL